MALPDLEAASYKTSLQIHPHAAGNELTHAAGNELTPANCNELPNATGNDLPPANCNELPNATGNDLPPAIPASARLCPGSSSPRLQKKTASWKARPAVIFGCY